MRSSRSAAGEERSLSVPLGGVFGEITVRAQPADAQVLVDGKSSGAANQTLRLVATTHEVVIRKTGFVDYKTSVTPRPGVAQVVETTLLTAEQSRLAATPAIDRDEGRAANEADADRALHDGQRRVASRAVERTRRSATSNSSARSTSASPKSRMVSSASSNPSTARESSGTIRSTSTINPSSASRGRRLRCSATGSRSRTGSRLPTRRRMTRLAAKTPLTERLSSADRRRMGMGGAPRSRRRAAPLPVGRRVACCAAFRQLRRRHRTSDPSGRHAGL